MKQGLDWLLSDMDRNRNLFPEGYGIMEVSGLNAELIDVAVYTQQALGPRRASPASWTSRPPPRDTGGWRPS